MSTDFAILKMLPILVEITRLRTSRVHHSQMLCHTKHQDEG